MTAKGNALEGVVPNHFGWDSKTLGKSRGEVSVCRNGRLGKPSNYRLYPSLYYITSVDLVFSKHRDIEEQI
jgi:hypothetical protein